MAGGEEAFSGLQWKVVGANLKKEARIRPCGVVGLWKSSAVWLMLIRYRRGSRKSGACLELGEKGPGDGNSKGCFFLFHCVCEKHKKVRMRTLSRVPVAGPWCEWKMETTGSGDLG